VKLGDLYNNMKEYDDAREYLNKAVESGNKANNKKVVAYALRSLGITALESGNFQEAEVVFKNTLSIFDTLQDHFMINDLKCYLAATYDEMDRFDEAEKLFDEAHLYFEKSGNVGDLYYISVDKGKHFFRKGEYKKAIESCAYAKDNLMKIGDIAWATKAWLCMYDAANISGDYKKALEFYQGYIKYKDSLTNEKNIQKITELNKEFEFTKEKEVIALENEQEIHKEKIFQKFLGLGLLLITALAFFSYRAYLIKTKANKTISSQNTQLVIYSKKN
jgi:tetratricopeptide (TPR) repeat protein